ncbi:MULTISPECIES: ester cyclase [unclassified Streptomyces]|uniref:ester cyclase n=1 Tax=unclassified Streptomyces TaxID=2593676 RepID=UPI001BE6A70F|nr:MULTISPECIES: ester cyclase [unclassified Streptomyces]MBT2407493.1 ester cyclase [Streptomyces sp. ISL-21]MBT2609116.1 ester cyclase [Streptomyces sp. ISL-87]
MGFFEAVSDRRLEDLPRFVAADVVDHNKIIHGEADEPGAAFEGLRQQVAAFDPLTVRVDELIGEADRVVARVTQGGVHGGVHPRMPEPTGRSFENEAIWIFTLADGRITQIRAVSDRLGLFLQLGWAWPQAD